MRELQLSVKCKAFRETGDFENDTAFQDVKTFIKERDNGACVYCGDIFEKYQEIHHKDDDHNNGKQDNLETVCSLCHACHHIGLAGIQGRGIIAYLPEISQIEINSTYKMLMCIAEQPKLHPLSKFTIQAEPWCVLSAPFSDKKGNPNIIGANLQGRVAIVENEYHKGWSNPAILGDMLLSLDSEAYAMRNDVLKDLRLIPVINGYTNQIDSWREHFLKTKPIQSWGNLADAAIEQLKDKQ